MEQRIVHPLAPLHDAHSRLLVLGTMPSPRSRETGFYYGHPQNRFWPALAGVFGEPVPADNAEKAALALRHGVALWDVLHSCRIVGASDASIREPVPNDIAGLLQATGIRRVYTTGTAAARYYARFCEPETHIPAVPLPSPSAANARMRLAELVEAYGVLRD